MTTTISDSGDSNVIGFNERSNITWSSKLEVGQVQKSRGTCSDGYEDSKDDDDYTRVKNSFVLLSQYSK